MGRAKPVYLSVLVTDPSLIPADLAPGDARIPAPAGLRFARVDHLDHPWFHRAYDRLWREFGDRGEMEARAVIARRLADPLRRAGDHLLHYTLLVVLAGDELVAVRDHTAIATPTAVVVHLSHVVVEPPLRGSGLAGWLRAVPLQTARVCAAAAGLAAAPITLVAEMEHPDGTPAVTARLRSYARAGFQMVDPAVAYLQPDFRPSAQIDASGVQPVPLALIVRRVGDESTRAITGAGLRDLVTALYTMYAADMPTAHMAPLWSRLAALPAADACIPLVPPLP
jgi:hypothetical protein